MEKYYQVFYDLLINLSQQMDTVLSGLHQEALDWAPGVDMNSIAVLAAHTTGATRFLIGDMVAGDPSNRDRGAEFRTQNSSADALKAHLSQTIAYCKTVLETLKLEDLNGMRTHPRDGKDYPVAWCLNHALEHFAQHVGHMEITRQMWEMQDI